MFLERCSNPRELEKEEKIGVDDMTTAAVANQRTKSTRAKFFAFLFARFNTINLASTNAYMPTECVSRVEHCMYDSG